MNNGLTKSDILGLWQTLNVIPHANIFVVDYAFERTKQFIKDEVEALQGAIKPSADFIEYDRKRLELCKLLAKKDENDNPVISGMEFVFDDPPEFQAELAKLNEEYQEVLNKRDEQIAAFNKAMLDSAESQVFKVKASKMPDVFGPFAQGLMPMIIDDISDQEKTTVAEQKN